MPAKVMVPSSSVAPSASVTRTRRTAAPTNLPSSSAPSSSAQAPSSERDIDGTVATSSTSRTSAARMRKTATQTSSTAATSASTSRSAAPTSARARAAAARSSSAYSAASTSRAAPSTATTTTSNRTPATSASACSARPTTATARSTATRPASTKAAVPSTRAARSEPSSAPPHPPISEAQILEQLADATACSPRLVPAIVNYLGTSTRVLGLSIETSTDAGSCEPIKSLSSARASYFAKQVVNAVLSSTTALVDSGWKLSAATLASSRTKGLPASCNGKVSGSGGRAAASTSYSASTSAPARTARTTTTKSATVAAAKTAAQQTNAPTPSSARALVDAFRVATRFLLESSPSSRSASAKGKELEVETVMLRYVAKLTALGFHHAAAEELLQLRRHILDSDESEADAPSDAKALDSAILLPDRELSTSRRSFFVELQSQVIYCRLEDLHVEELASFAQLLRHDEGPLAWQRRERTTCSPAPTPASIKTADRAAYLIERSIARCLQRLGGQTGAKSLPLRAVALHMLLMISDVDASAFWDRVARTGTSCVRSEVAEGGDAREAFGAVQQLFQDLVDAARHQRDEGFCGGDGYVGFCESWMALAKKVRSSDSIDEATNAMTSMSISSSAPASPPLDEAEPTPSGSSTSPLMDDGLIRLSGKLVKAVVVLDQALKDGGEVTDVAAERILSEALLATQDVASWPSTARTSNLVKLYRVLDQVRRRSLMVVDGSTKAKAETRPSTPDSRTAPTPAASTTASIAVELLSAVLQLQSAALSHSFECRGRSTAGVQDQKDQMPPPLEQLNNLVYTFRFLANVRFQAASRARQDECHAYLTRCCDLVVEEDGAKEALPADVRSQNLFLVSSSFYNIGGRLYSDRQFDAAVRFLEPACRTGSQSVRLHQQWKEHGPQGDDDKTDDSNATSDEEVEKRQGGMSKKWEHLAVSYRLGSNKAKAVEAYREAIFSLPQASWRKLEQQAAVSGTFATFRDPQWATLASLLKSTVELCVFDLFKPQEVSSEAEASVAAWMANFAEFPKVAALMLEHCAATLEPRYHHEEALGAAVQLLDAARSIYKDQPTPIRQVRVLLKQAEMELFSAARGSSLQEIEALLEQAQTSLSAKTADMAEDAGLARLLPQYRASLALLQVELEQRRASSSSCAKIVEHVQRACKYLTPLVAAQSASLRTSTMQKRPSPGSTTIKADVATPVHKVASSRPTPSTRVLKPRNAPPQTKAAAVPVTPPPRASRKVATGGGKVNRASISPPITGTSAALSPGSSAAATAVGVLDNPERFCNHLEHVYESLATYGHTPSSIEVAKVLRRLSHTVLDGSAAGRDIYLRVSASLARQYLHLGKLPRAGTVLNQALHFFQKTDAGRDVSSDTKFRCLMASAEYLCRTGLYERSVQRFEEAVDLARREPAKGSSMQVALEKCRAVERRAIAAEVHSTILCSNGDLAGAIQSAVQAVRLGARMTTLLGRLTAPASAGAAERNGGQDKKQRDIFSAPTSDIHADAIAVAANVPAAGEGSEEIRMEKRKPRLSSFVVAAMHWRLSRFLVQAYLRVSQLYSVRGSGSDAEAFAGDGIELANAMSSSLALSRALIQRGEIRIQLGQVTLGQDDLSSSLALLQENWIPEAIVLTCIQGDSLARIEQLPEALKSYATGEATLRSLNTAFTELDAILPSPRPAAAAASSRRSSPTTGRRHSSSNGIAGIDALLPEVQSRLLRRQGWILQLLGRTEESEDLFERALAVYGDPSHAGIDARFDQHLVQGRVSLRRALQHLKGDRLLSMLPDAAISMPMVPSSASSKALPICIGSNSASAAAMKSAMSLLYSADSAFTDALEQGGASSHALAVREAFISLAQVQTMQGTLSKGSKGAAEGAAALVDSALSVNIRRDLMHAIDHKLKDRTALEDLNAWPSFKVAEAEGGSDDDASVCGSDYGGDDKDDGTAMLGKKMSRMGLSSEPDPVKETAAAKAKAATKPASTLSEYWKLVQSRHLASQSATTRDSPDLLPRNWTVVSLTYLKDRETLLLTRQTGGGGADGCQANEPTIYSLPLDRQSNRDMEESELTMQSAQERLEEIVRTSNDGIHGAKDVEGMEARKRWWTARRTLDKALEDLLAEMQNTWLGAFKGLFGEPVRDDGALVSLRSRFDKIIKRACFPPTAANKKTHRLKLDDAVFECFAGFPADCSDEDFEDLLHYVMDALQFSGLQVAVDEVDLDEVAIDLRNALEEFRGKQAKAASASHLSPPTKHSLLVDTAGEHLDHGDGLGGGGAGGVEADHHLFLVLDKETAMFPWESMPILRRQAVSRIPSMAFLQDRIDLARVYHQLPGEDDRRGLLIAGRKAAGDKSGKPRSRSKTKNGGGSDERREAEEAASWKVALRNGRLFNLSKRRTAYLLNPGGDLVRTQERFEPWLKSRTSRGWRGITGREPILEELPKLLSTSDVLLYFGHAGAEQYIRRSKVRELERCAVTMLFGCSSAMLRDQGEFDRTGTPFNYMCAGSPAMVGNLWDTTDRELDSVCEGILTKLGLMDEGSREGTQTTKPAGTRKEASRAPKEMSIVRAVAESRDECKLGFLTGAACVVYGVPVYWAHEDE